MNITEKVLESYNKLSEEEQRSFLPALKKFAKYAETDKKIYESKQSYRWKKVADNKYFIAYKDNILLIQQQKDRLCFIK